jgi:hypothetical protein
MATGNQVLPGAPVTTERAVTAEQQMMAGRGAGASGWADQASGYESEPGVEQPQRIARRGSGGRWLVWVLRAVVWIVLLLIGYRGIAAIVTSYQGKPAGTGGSAGQPAGQSADGFPVSLASAFALEFSQVYLNFSPATAAQRATELAPFLPPGTDPKLGWNGSGSQSVQSEQVAGVQVQGPHNAIVEVLGLTSGRLIEIGVPVYYANGGMVVPGQPALLPPPATVVPPAAAKVATDGPVQQALNRELPAFFTAFAAGPSTRLAAFAAPGTQLSGLGGEVTFGSIVNITGPTPGGSTRNIVVTVAWLPASTPSAGPPSSAASGRAQLDMTYAMTVVRRAGIWYVASIDAAATSAGPSS